MLESNVKPRTKLSERSIIPNDFGLDMAHGEPPTDGNSSSESSDLHGPGLSSESKHERLIRIEC